MSKEGYWRDDMEQTCASCGRVLIGLVVTHDGKQYHDLCLHKLLDHAPERKEADLSLMRENGRLCDQIAYLLDLDNRKDATINSLEKQLEEARCQWIEYRTMYDKQQEKLFKVRDWVDRTLVSFPKDPSLHELRMLLGVE